MPHAETPRTPHLATVSHEGRFWDVYLGFEESRGPSPESCRGYLTYSPADGEGESRAVQTTTIIIEPTYDAALRRAMSFGDHQLVALLRSVLPE